MDDLLREFLTETTESIAVLDVELVKLEQNPNDPGMLNNIFRLVHTIKGTCGFLGLPRLEAVAHSAENVLGKVRDGEMTVTPQAISLILKALDRIKSLVSQLEATESEPAGEDSDLTSQLNALAEGRLEAVEAPAAEAEAEEAPADAPKQPEPVKAAEPPKAKKAAKPAGSPYERFGGDSMVDAMVDATFQNVAGDQALTAMIDASTWICCRATCAISW
jgi:two-component system chemotaxis sensor kinase CheA